jgi:NADPH:quinone reductase-like Zn-dependent oxidoreductase
MKQVIFKETGLPESVLHLEEAAIPEPRAHESLIRITARNINPSDIMFIQGRYGITPKLPSSAGFEAAGEVEKSEQYPRYSRNIHSHRHLERVCLRTHGPIDTYSRGDER